MHQLAFFYKLGSGVLYFEFIDKEYEKARHPHIPGDLAINRVYMHEDRNGAYGYGGYQAYDEEYPRNAALLAFFVFGAVNTLLISHKGFLI